MKNSENNANIEILKDELRQYIDQMDEFHTRLVLSFIKTLYNLSD